MSNVVDFKMARTFRGAQKTARIRVGFQGGFAYYDSLGAAFAEIHLAAEAGDRAFCIDIRTGPDETSRTRRKRSAICAVTGRLQAAPFFAASDRIVRTPEGTMALPA